jgi:hypothetical protein
MSCKELLGKIAKEKRFYWKRNLCFSLLPIVLVWLALALTNKSDQEEGTYEKNDIFNPETEVN